MVLVINAVNVLPHVPLANLRAGLPLSSWAHPQVSVLSAGLPWFLCPRVFSHPSYPHYPELIHFLAGEPQEKPWTTKKWGWCLSTQLPCPEVERFWGLFSNIPQRVLSRQDRALAAHDRSPVMKASFSCLLSFSPPSQLCFLGSPFQANCPNRPSVLRV